MGKAAGEVRIFKKADSFVIAAALIAAAVGFILVFTRPAGEYIEIAVDGDIVETLPLDRDARYELPNNVIAVENGAARMEHADCPDLICVHHSPISRRNETIVCLPNRVTVTVRGGRSNVDAISE